MSTQPIESTAPTCDRERLITEHLGMSKAIVNRYRNRGVDVDDLEQVAALALVKAADRFTPGRGAFAPFAAATIRGEVKKHFRDRAWDVRPPRKVQELHSVLAREYAGQMLDSSTMEQLAAEHDVPRTVVVEALSVSSAFAADSLDRPAVDSGTPRRDSLQSGPTAFDGLEDRMDLWRCLQDLPATDRRLIRWYYFECLSQTTIAEKTGVTQMTVSRRIKAVIERMRTSLDPGGTVLA